MPFARRPERRFSPVGFPAAPGAREAAASAREVPRRSPRQSFLAGALAFTVLLFLSLAVPPPAEAAGVRADEARAAVFSRALAGMPAKRLFAQRKTPANLPPQPIGFYSRGCAAGNVSIALTGDAWQVMRPKRNRYWGQPVLIRFLKDFAQRAKREIGWNGLMIGDLSQPRGGPMLTGHASHQIGLDADIWLMEMPARTLSMRERNTMSAVLMTLDRKRINPRRFTVRHARLLRMAAKYPEVQRIFVHPPIKKFLCDWSRRSGEKDRRWLARIRPYYGHNYHFHVRLRCPKGAKLCKDQGDPREPDGTGCGRNLAYWYSDKPWGGGKARKPRRFYHGIPIPRPRPRKPRPRRQITLADLPKACRRVLLAE